MIQNQMLLGALGIAELIGVFLVPYLVYLGMSMSLGRVFEMTGRYEGWKAFVPGLSLYVLLKITDLPIWLVLLGFIPRGIGAVLLHVILMAALGKKLNCSVGFTLGLIFLSPVFLYVLAFHTDVKWPDDGDTVGLLPADVALN